MEYVVEYSVEQKAWNIDTLKNALKNNLDMVIRKVSNDYKIIAVCSSQAEASRIYNQLKDKM